MARLGAALVCSMLCGCVSFEREMTGDLTPIIRAREFQNREATLREVLARLGPPDLMLKAGEVNRAYYTYWEKGSLRLVVKVVIPGLVQGPALDIFVMSLGKETLWLTRFDFDPSGHLKAFTRDIVELGKSGYYGAIDNTVVTEYLEERDRILHVWHRAPDEDEEEEEARAKE